MNEYEKWWEDYKAWVAPIYELGDEEYALARNVIDTWVMQLYWESY